MALISPGSQDLSRGRVWILTPIDDCGGFLRKQHYAVSLALMQDSKLVMGVMACPNLPYSGITMASCDDDEGVLLVGIPGKGLTQISIDGTEEMQIGVSGNKSAKTFVEDVEPSKSDQTMTAKIAQRLGVDSANIERIDGMTKFAVVARGDVDVFIKIPHNANFHRSTLWNCAAGTAIVEAAGGKVTDLFGKALTLDHVCLADNVGIIATNGPLHVKVLEAAEDIKKKKSPVQRKQPSYRKLSSAPLQLKNSSLVVQRCASAAGGTKINC